LNPRDLNSQRRLYDILHGRCQMLLKQGRAPEGYVLAKQALDAARRLVENDALDDPSRCRLMIAALSDVAWAAYQRGLPEETERVHCEALELRRQLAERESPQPDDVRQYAVYLNWSAVPQMADPQRALAVAQRALELSGGTDPVYWQTLGWCYYALKDGARARECVERALELVPDEATALREKLCKQLETIKNDLPAD